MTDQPASDGYHIHTLPNGFTLLAEPMDGVASAAMTLQVAAGAASDPVSRLGTATVLSELVLRGAGDRDSRTLTEYLDFLGLMRGASAGTNHTRFSAAGVSGNVLEALPAYADVLRRPHLKEDDFQAARELAVAALQGLDDDPRQQLFVLLREWFWPAPLGRNAMGDPEHLAKMTVDTCKLHHAERYQPDDGLIAVAGKIDVDAWRSAVEAQLGDWTGPGIDEEQLHPPAGPRHFEETDSEQTHIGLAMPAEPEQSPEYYAARVAIEILGGSSSARLFTEVREKRGLCYAVSASYSSLPGLAGLFIYSGTSNERAQATLDTINDEVKKFGQGVSEDEVERAKVGLAAATVMASESTSARANALARDWRVHGRLRSLDEIVSAIETVTVADVNAYAEKQVATPVTRVIVGPKDLAD
ncbi:MAG: pitrilysin family protein [Planctomycetota bacterium]